MYCTPEDEIRTQVQYRLIEELAAAKQRYRNFADNIRDVVFQCDDAWRLTYVNSAWAHVFGHGPEESLGRSITEFLDSDVLGDAPSRSFRLSHEMSLPSANGAVRWFELTLWPGVPDGLVGLLHDVTERKQTTKELQTQKERIELERANLSAILDTVPVAMLIVDEEMQIVRLNATAARLVNRQSSDLPAGGPGDLLCCLRTTDDPPDNCAKACHSCAIRKSIERVFREVHEELRHDVPGLGRERAALDPVSRCSQCQVVQPVPGLRPDGLGGNSSQCRIEQRLKDTPAALAGLRLQSRHSFACFVVR